MQIDQITQSVLKVINDGEFKQEGAFNLRYNGQPLCHGDSEHVKIKRKEDKNGMDVYIDGQAKGERIQIPVVVTVSGMTDVVYNDFYIEDGADVVIVAGCGLHNSGCDSTRHDGIHSFHVGKGCNVRYEEKRQRHPGSYQTSEFYRHTCYSTADPSCPSLLRPRIWCCR